MRKRISDWLLLVLCAVSAGLGLNALVSWLQLDTLSHTYEQVRQQYAVPVLQGILQYAVVAPLAEEFLFRGIVYRLSPARLCGTFFRHS